MPSLLYVCRGQSEAIFHEDTTFQYREAALVSAGVTGSGGAKFASEINRRLPTWTVNRQGSSSGVTQTRWGGTSFIDEWMDPRIAPGDDTAITSNTDARIVGRFGEDYFNALDIILAANAAGADNLMTVWMRQTWESDDRAPNGGAVAWPFNITEYARGVSLFVNFELSKMLAYGKPSRVYMVHPGPTDRGNANHALMREVTQHLAVNGRRSTRAELAGFPVIAGFYIGGHAVNQVTFAAAQQADTGTSGTDFAHQSQGSSQRTGAALAVEVAQWLDSGATHEFDGHPYIDSAFRVTGSPNLVRAKVKITTGNKLVWQGPDALDTDLTTYGGFTAFPLRAHLSVHATPINSSIAPTPLGVTSIAVGTGAPSGFAYLDITLSSAVPSTAYLTHNPEQTTPGYTRRAEVIATTLKKKVGLYEDGTAAGDLVVDAAMSDVLRSPVEVAMPVFPVTNLLVGPEESDASVSNLSDAGETLIAQVLFSTPGARPTAWYLALGTGFTDGSGLTGELSGGGYTRLFTDTWTVSGRTAAIRTSGPFATNTGATHWALYTAASSGTALFGGAITDSSTLGVNAGRFTLTLGGDLTEYAANMALRWLLTTETLTLPVAPFAVTAATSLVGGTLFGEVPGRASVTPSTSGGVATFTGPHTIAITGDAGPLGAIGLYDAIAGGNLLAAKAVTSATTGSAGDVTIATFTITLD